MYIPEHRYKYSEPRELIVLYKLLLLRQKKTDLIYRGICNSMNELYVEEVITLTEKLLLKNDFLDRKPKWYNSRFWWNSAFRGSGYWWYLTSAGQKQRVKFLEDIITKLS